MRAHIETVTLAHEKLFTSKPVKWRTLHRIVPSEQRCLSGTVDYARDDARKAKWPISCKMFTICYIDPLLHPRAKNLRQPPLRPKRQVHVSLQTNDDEYDLASFFHALFLRATPPELGRANFYDEDNSTLPTQE